MSKFLLGADFGTTGVKAVLFNPETLETFQSGVYDYPTFHKQHSWAEQSPDNWWKAFKKAARDVISKSSVPGEDIVGVGISGMGGAGVCLDKEGNILRDTMFWMDARTEKQSKWLVSNFKEELEKCNVNSSTVFSVPQLLWIKENEPEIYEKTKTILTLTGFINWKLTGVPSANPCESSLWCIMDLKTSSWNKNLADKIGIDINKMAPLSECTEIIGHISKEVSEETGIPEGIPVVAGGHDVPSSVLGMGIFNPGEVFYSMGTGSNLAVLTEKPVLDFNNFSERHVMPDMWIYDAVLMCTGSSLKWFVTEFGNEEKKQAEKTGADVYQLFSEYAEKAPAGANGLVFTPYLSGEISPVFDGNARGVFIGVTFRTDKACMTRAIMEGVCFSVKHNISMFEEQGIEINEIKVQGGPSKSKVWMQALADITGKRIETLELADASPIGDAILAGLAVGLIEDAAEVTKRLVNVADVFEPNKANRETYEILFNVYQNVYEKHKDDFRNIKNL